MAPVIPIALGAAALFLFTRKSEGSYSQAPSDGSSPPVKEKAPAAKSWQEMPQALQEQVAAALGALGVSPATGQLSGSGVTADAIKMATQTAALCESQGFYDIAKQLRGYIAQAAPTVPTPPEAAAIAKAAPPGLTPEQITALTRTLTLDRDPKVIQQTIEMLSRLPASPERDSLIAMAQALLLQLAAAQSTTQTMQQIDQVIKSPGIAEVHAAVQPLPPVVVPVVTPAPAPTSSAPAPSTPAPKPPAAAPAAQAPAPANAAAPTTVPSPTNWAALSMEQLKSLTGTRLLKVGSKGEDVKAWQQILRNDGYSGTVLVDGIFQTKTQAATKLWQKGRPPLVNDGEVGALTRAKIGTLPVQVEPPQSLPKPAPAPSSTSPRLSFAEVKDPTPNAKALGDGRANAPTEVKSWQTILTALGYGSVIGKIDGVWGPKIKTATMALQQYAKSHYKDSKPIDVDGVVGPQARRIVLARTAELKGTIVAGRRQRIRRAA
jgi:peptidoglycan hydrolase-like protein with peptidoglycan-binding domain